VRGLPRWRFVSAAAPGFMAPPLSKRPASNKAETAFARSWITPRPLGDMPLARFAARRYNAPIPG